MNLSSMRWPAVVPLAQTSATSGAAKRVAELLRNVTEHDRRKATDWRPVVRASIEQLAAECSARDWDGYGATAISELVKQNAQQLVDSLPADLPEPQAGPDPDGEISLSWDFGPDYIFTISIGEAGTLSYAGILGKGVKRYGQEPFRGDVAKILIESVRKISPAG